MAPTALVNLSDAQAGWGTISYNGYTFPGLRNVSLTSEQVYDRAERVVMFTRYTAKIHFFVVDDDAGTHETTMIGLRRMLTEPGKTLVFADQGVGDIQINGAGATRTDVEWGPKPRVLDTTQIGGVCTEVTWECTFTLKESLGAQGPIAAFNYTVDWSINAAGGSTRTITGYLKITQTRQGGAKNYVGITADTYRDWIRVLIPPGMQRRERQFRLSEDRNTLDFTIVDVQLEAEAPPDGVLRAELDYDIRSIPPGFARYVATLSGTIETPQGAPTIRAGKAFVRILIDKFAKLKQATGNQGTVIPLAVAFGRTLGTRLSTFSMSWTVQGCLDDLLRRGGIWERVSGSSWQSWANSMREGRTWDNRGQAVLAYNRSSDALIDLEWTGGLPPIADSGGTLPPEETGSHIFSLDGITKGNSWVAFENTIRAYRDYNSSAHRFQTGFSPREITEGDIATQEGVTMAQQISGAPPMVVQHDAPPTEYILMYGKAMRIKYHPSVPRLVTIGGKKVEEVKVRTDGPTVVACYFGESLYVVRWAILYRVVGGHLDKIPVKKNPALCCGDEE